MTSSLKIVSLVAAVSLLVSQGRSYAFDQQTADVRCGAYCLMTALLTLDQAPVSLDELLETLGPPTTSGYSIHQLQLAAERYGAFCAAVRTTPANLRQRNKPLVCIALLNNQHFAILADVNQTSVTVVDPPRSYEVPLETMLTQWDGTALLISDRPLEAEESLAGRIQRSHFLWNGAVSAALVALLIILIRMIRSLNRSSLSSRTPLVQP
jgi:ABC-type bacteriocin/lantibiotic exporter with double-glycine peptidase domain